MTPGQFQSIKQYVGFDERSATLLRAFYPVAEPHLTRIVKDFYDAIQAHPDAVAAITGGAAQVERLKRSLTVWLTEVLLGPHDRAYLDKHSRIGRVHVRINLPQEYMFTAINRIRVQLISVVHEDPSVDEADRPRLEKAIHQMLDLELALMLDTYRENFVEAIRIGERLSTLGQLSATIAHELRNPLGVIESSLFILQRQLDKLGLSDPVLQKHHQRISAQVDACGATIRNMLDLARDRPLAVRRANVRELVDRAVAEVRVPEDVSLEVLVDDELSVEVDPDQMSMALQHLLTNAIHAVGDGGHVSVEALHHAQDTWFTVSDDGPGMSTDVRGRAFEALFTTKDAAAGLGLPVARRIAELHGGALELVPTERGARFRLSVPTRTRAALAQTG